MSLTQISPCNLITHPAFLFFFFSFLNSKQREMGISREQLTSSWRRCLKDFKNIFFSSATTKNCWLLQQHSHGRYLKTSKMNSKQSPDTPHCVVYTSAVMMHFCDLLQSKYVSKFLNLQNSRATRGCWYWGWCVISFQTQKLSAA